MRQFKHLNYAGLWLAVMAKFIPNAFSIFEQAYSLAIAKRMSSADKFRVTMSPR